MKKLLLAAALTISTASNASSVYQQYCDSMYDLAKIIMDARQNGITEEQSRKIVNDGKNNDLKAVANTFVDLAYDEPVMKYDDLKKTATEDFAEMAKYACEVSMEKHGLK